MDNEKSYKVIELEKYNGILTTAERKFRKILKGEVLVKVIYTTIHPADTMFIFGQYGAVIPEVMPIIPGFEGSGDVVEVGEEVDSSLIGKRVTILANPSSAGSFHGTWAEYSYVEARNLIVYNSTKIDYEKIAFGINPLTCCGFIDTITKKKVEAIIQNKAASNLGQIVIRWCNKTGIKTINLVKDKNQAKRLKEIEPIIIFDASSKSWVERT